jgi:acyl carrier protein
MIDLKKCFARCSTMRALTLTNEMTAPDIEGWDSVAHINLMFGIEQAFGVRFKGNELAEMKNIGELKQFLIGKGAG